MQISPRGCDWRVRVYESQATRHNSLPFTQYRRIRLLSLHGTPTRSSLRSGSLDRVMRDGIGRGLDASTMPQGVVPKHCKIKFTTGPS
ncbi:hypothetical protein BST61_g6858 [Cercospora zeina]